MSIRKWRYIRYTDDGSTLYQCLNCYGSFDTRECPSYVGFKPRPYKSDDPYHCHYDTKFYFCPYCGIQWQGEVPVDESLMWKRPQSRTLERGKTVYFWWVIEKRELPWHIFSDIAKDVPSEWKIDTIIRGLNWPVWFVKEYLEYSRKKVRCEPDNREVQAYYDECKKSQDWMLPEPEYTLVPTEEFRLVKVKDLDEHYGEEGKEYRDRLDILEAQPQERYKQYGDLLKRR